MTGSYSADTDDLDAFVELSGRNVAAFRARAQGLEAGRNRLAALPLPSFVQSPTLGRYREFLSGVGDNGRFVAEVSDALKHFGVSAPNGLFRADAALIDKALAVSDTDRLDDLEQSLIAQGLDPNVAAGIVAEVGAALRSDAVLSFDAAVRAGFAAHQGISVEEAAQAARAFSLSPPEAAAVLDQHFDLIAGRHGNNDHITIEDLHDVVGDVSVGSEVRDAAYRLAADAVLFNNLDVAHQTDLSDEPLAVGFAWSKTDGVISRDDVAAFPLKNYQARILLAWHPLVETAGQGYDLTKADSHASAGDVIAFVEDQDIPAYIRLAVFDVYAERHQLEVSEREILEQELAFDGTNYRSTGTFLDASQLATQTRTAPIAPARPSPGTTPGRSGGSGGAVVAAIAAQFVITAGEFGWNQGRQHRIERDGNPTITHTDPNTGATTSIDPAELADLTPVEAKAYVAYYFAHGTAPPHPTIRIEPHPYLDPSGQWRMSDTNQPTWPEQSTEPLAPGQYIDLQGQRRWSDTNQLVEHFPNRSQYQDDNGTWRWADTGAPVNEATANDWQGTSTGPETSGTLPPRAPIDYDGHVINGEVKPNGKVVGGHSIAGGNVRVVEGTATTPDALGVYDAIIEVRDSQNPGQWLRKSYNEGVSTMFPDSWSPERIKLEVDFAYQNRLEVGNKWTGTTPTGVRVTGYLKPKTTVFPIYSE